MTRSLLAPWGEVLPEGQPLLTAADLARMPDDARGYELVEGRLVKTMSPTGTEHGVVAMELGAALRAYAKPRKLGMVFAAETGFQLNRPGEPDTVLAPDVAFVRTERVPPRGSPERAAGFWRLAPDLAGEVASPGQYRPEMSEKARRWLAAGTRLVWIVWPATHEVDVWTAGSDTSTTLREGDVLDGGEVVPGFRYSVAELFAV